MHAQAQPVRALHWAGTSTLSRCAAQIAAACAGWARDWTGRPLEVDVQPLPAAGPADAEPACTLVLPCGAWVAVRGAEHLLAGLLDGAADGLGQDRPAPDDAAFSAPGAPDIAHAAARACAADLPQRLLAALQAPLPADPVVQWDLPVPQATLPYAGTAVFGVTVGEVELQVTAGGAAVARLAGPVALALQPQALDAALLRRVAGRTRVRGRLQLTGARLPLGALLRAEVGDVIVLDRPLDAWFEWEVPALGLRVPAQLVRSGNRLAAELMTDSTP